MENAFNMELLLMVKATATSITLDADNEKVAPIDAVKLAEFAAATEETAGTGASASARAFNQ